MDEHELRKALLSTPASIAPFPCPGCGHQVLIDRLRPTLEDGKLVFTDVTAIDATIVGDPREPRRFRGLSRQDLQDEIRRLRAECEKPWWQRRRAR